MVKGALIVGCGRIGTGYGWPKHAFAYTHADAYRNVRDKITLVGAVDGIKERRDYASHEYKIPTFDSIKDALERTNPNIVSICTSPDGRVPIVKEVRKYPSVEGLWIEKPLSEKYEDSIKIAHMTRNIWTQVNYIRRFDSLHRDVKKRLEAGEFGDVIKLVFFAKPDWTHTMCHFVDLTRWLGVPLTSCEFIGVNGADYVMTEYKLICTKKVIDFKSGGMWASISGPHDSEYFPNAVMPEETRVYGGYKAQDKLFMEEAVTDLYSAIDSRGDTVCPADDAAETDRITKEVCALWKTRQGYRFPQWYSLAPTMPK